MSLSKRIILTVKDYSVGLSSPIKLYQNDQIYLIFEINEYGIDVTGTNNRHEKIMPINPLKAYLFFETPLGTDSVESVDIIDNAITFHLESNYTQHIGISKMQIQLIDEGCCRITLPEFPFEIRENIYDNRPLLRTVLLSDEENTLLVDENGNALNIGTEITPQTYAVATPKSLVSDIATKQIKDYDLDSDITGVEDILVQDDGVTKRVKVSGLVQGAINLDDYYTKDDLTFDENSVVPVTLGGIEAGTNLNDLSVQDVLSKLLFPYIAPVITASITKNPNKNTYEYGEQVLISKITCNVTKKTEKITNISFLDSSNILKQITSGVENGGNFTYTFTEPVIITSNLSNSRFRVTVTDSSTKTIYANTSNINFYYPYYFGIVEENQVITSDLFANFTKKIEAKGTKTNSYTTNNQCMLIAYPKSYGALKKIIDQNSFDVTNTFIKSEINVIGLDKTSQTYYVYVNNASTVTDFKITFQY